MVKLGRLLQELNVGAYFMLNKLSKAMREDTVGNITYRTSYITGKITAVGTNNRYDVEIASCGKSRKNVFTNDPNIIYKVDDTVGIGWEDGNREKPIIIGILREITLIEVNSGVNSLGV